MNKVKVSLILSVVICLFAVFVVKILAESESAESAITIRKLDEQTVLYTIHKGSYDKIGPKVGSLYALAGKNGISPRGSAYYVYLNNPNQVSSEHWLTEIRIPVSKESLKSAGTLGEMTDVKKLPAAEAAVIVKPQGQSDPSTLYKQLYTWLIKNGYMPAGQAREVFLTNAMSGDYSMMKTEIMIPVEKISSNKN